MNYGGGVGSFVVRILYRVGRIIRPRDLEPERNSLIIYVWMVGPRANTLVRLWTGDYLWVFLPYQWRYYIKDVKTHLINECLCLDLTLVSCGNLPMGGPTDLELVRTVGFRKSLRA
jgi:hypothetical protein